MRRNSVWIAVLALAAAAVAAFAVAVVISGEIPATGDARREALLTALVAGGGTAGGAAVALSGVLLTLGLQERAERRRRWADLQVAALREAYEWLQQTSRTVGDILALLIERSHALDAYRPALTEKVNARAQRFYDEEQRLHVVERLTRVIDSDEVKRALWDADGALRQWNEGVAGDHTTRRVDVDAAPGGTAGATYTAVSSALHAVLDAYAEALRRSHR